jgi:hypothetical protein
VQNLTAWEIWFFITGRVLMSFGLGVLVMTFQNWAAGLRFPLSLSVLFFFSSPPRVFFGSGRTAQMTTAQPNQSLEPAAGRSEVHI